MECGNSEDRVIVAVSALIFNESGQILIVQRSSEDDFLPGDWELPGGEVGFGELPIGALLREIREECGIAISVGLPLFVSAYFTDQTNNEQCFEVFYLCSMKEPNQKIKLSGEHAAHRWVRFSELSAIEMSERTRDIIGSFENHPLIRMRKACIP